MHRAMILPLLIAALVGSPALSQEPSKDKDSAPRLDTRRGDQMIAEYFRLETEKLQRNCLAEIQTLDDWNAKRGEYRRQLLEMLGLDPMPERTDLAPVVTGKVEHEEFTVEKLHFQSRPGLYVTGDLYVPKNVDPARPLPAILYVCGHGAVKKDGVSYGNKVTYQHHGGWFARNGYVCLTIDSLQLGEIEGIHHGTHRYGMWWWLNRGYTPAGVEAWNCVRALDYLETRPEVDKARFGVTGRSGGGAYSWWIAAIDERIKCAVPVAGITDLQNHVVDGCVEGHCDCMYMVNTYRWDYPQVAALVAPRPLLISNTDTDGIFPLDGVVRTFEHVRRIYRLYDATEKGTSAKVALNISPGPHKDTQELQVHAFRWFNHYLKGDDSLVEDTAVKFFEPEQLKVFDKLPEDQQNTEIHETFVAAAGPPAVPADNAEWKAMRGEWKEVLSEKSFRGWPETEEPLDVQKVFDVEREGARIQAFDFTSQPGMRLRMFVIRRPNAEDIKVAGLAIMGDDDWSDMLTILKSRVGEELKDEDFPPSKNNILFPPEQLITKIGPLEMPYQALVMISPRGLGRHRWDQSEKKQTQNRRRFYLLGQTLEGQQVWDVRRSIQAFRQDHDLAKVPFTIGEHGPLTGVALYASLFEPNIAKIELFDLPKTHREGPTFLNVSRYLDMPQAVAMAAERSKVVIYQDDDAGWEYPQAVAAKLGWDAKQIQIRRKPGE